MKYALKEIIDIEQFQSLQDRLNEIYSFPSAIIDNEGNVLTATAWQEICTKFHRRNQECERECVKSDQYILEHLAEANPAVSYRCPHGLIDNATPIIIDGEHVGNFFTGQFFLEPPDLTFFKRQASRFGFDEDAYLAAVRKVPIWSQEQLNSYLFFIKGLIEVISNVGLKNLREIEVSKKLQESEAQLRSILDNSANVVFVKDLEGRYLRINRRYEELFHVGRDAIIGKTDFDIFPHDVARSLQDADRGAIAAGGPIEVEEEVPHDDGPHVYISIKFPLVGTDGKPYAVCGIATDITERTRAEEAMLESEEKFKALFQQAGDYAFILDPCGPGRLTIVDANESACQAHGYERDELIGQSVLILDAALTAEQSGEALSRVMGGEVSQFETVHRRRDGTTFPVEVTAKAVRFGGRSPLILSVERDISERKRLEQARLNSQRMESLGTLAGGMAHDFNNILGAILGNAELAVLDTAANHPAAPNLAEIRKAAERAREVVRRMMAFARPKETGQAIIELAPVVEEVIGLLRPAIPASIALQTRFGAETPPVHADSGQVHEALVNLTTNALHAIGSKAGTIAYALDSADIAGATAKQLGLSAGRYVVLSVRDDGCGMDEATRRRAFDAFFSTKPAGEGSGLGLSVVYGIMNGHGGAVSVESAPEAGATFCLYFPVAGRSAQSEPQSTSKPRTAAVSAGRRVMYIDDEQALASLAKRMFARLGHSVSVYNDPTVALEAFRSLPDDYDFVVTDLSMPKMSGFDLTRELKAIRPDIPVIMATGHIRADDEATAREIGVQELIMKPFSVEQLGQVIERLVKRVGQSQ